LKPVTSITLRKLRLVWAVTQHGVGMVSGRKANMAQDQQGRELRKKGLYIYIIIIIIIIRE
jgi:hypothetical protein